MRIRRRSETDYVTSETMEIPKGFPADPSGRPVTASAVTSERPTKFSKLAQSVAKKTQPTQAVPPVTPQPAVTRVGEPVEPPVAATSFLDNAGDGGEEILPKRGGFGIFRKAIREFRYDNGTDIAAALTYYGAFAILPTLLALISILGLVGQGQNSVQWVLDVLHPVVSESFLDSIRPALQSIADSDAAKVTFLVGVVAALWSASAYVGAFGRAMNRVYEVEEGRPFWRLRPMNLLVTVLTVGLCAAGLLIVLATGSVARSLGHRLGVDSQFVQVWDIIKWPVLLFIVIVVIALLYHLTPNVRQGRPRLLSIGAVVAIVVWAVASAGLAIYVLNMHSFDRTYGSLAGVMVILFWLWITNVALIFGAEIDSELERARQLHRGIAAEERLQLVPRSEKRSIRLERRRIKEIAQARALREARVGVGDPEDRPF